MNQIDQMRELRQFRRMALAAHDEKSGESRKEWTPFRSAVA